MGTGTIQIRRLVGVYPVDSTLPIPISWQIDTSYVPFLLVKRHWPFTGFDSRPPVMVCANRNLGIYVQLL